MTIKKNERLISIASVIISAIPILWAFVIFYKDQNVLAENVRQLQDEREYIRDKLDQIVVKLSAIDGQINEHVLRNDGCKRSE